MKKVQKYKICRRLGSGVFEKCQTAKFVASEAKHLKNSKNKRPKVLSGYGLQFVEKQKVRMVYNISEKQLSNYIKIAISKKDSSATDYLFELLETRLDNVVYRLGLASTRRLARQIVSHGHILLNGKKTTIASAKVKLNDVVSVREGSKKSVLFSELETKLKDYNCPNWLSFNISTLTGIVQGKPKNTEGFFDLNTVLEFYSR
jgi:small subunit ribosomal protein S4